MSSLRPSLVIDEDDDWGALSGIPSSTSSRPSFTLSTPSSGEFNSFSNVGAVLAGGESNMRFGFWMKRFTLV
jgi:hypothetical protein